MVGPGAICQHLEAQEALNNVCLSGHNENSITATKAIQQQKPQTFDQRREICCSLGRQRRRRQEEEESWGSGDNGGTGYGRAQHQQAGRGCTYLPSYGCTYGSQRTYGCEHRPCAFLGSFEAKYQRSPTTVTEACEARPHSASKTLFQCWHRLQHRPEQPGGQGLQWVNRYDNQLYPGYLQRARLAKLGPRRLWLRVAACGSKQSIHEVPNRGKSRGASVIMEHHMESSGGWRYSQDTCPSQCDLAASGKMEGGACTLALDKLIHTVAPPHPSKTSRLGSPETLSVPSLFLRLETEPLSVVVVVVKVE